MHLSVSPLSTFFLRASNPLPVVMSISARHSLGSCSGACGGEGGGRVRSIRVRSYFFAALPRAQCSSAVSHYAAVQGPASYISTRGLAPPPTHAPRSALPVVSSSVGSAGRPRATPLMRCGACVVCTHHLGHTCAPPSPPAPPVTADGASTRFDSTRGVARHGTAGHGL